MANVYPTAATERKGGLVLKKEFVRLAAIHRRTLVIAVALMAPLACLGIASPALAKEPTGAFAPFNQCPRFTAGVEFCDYALITGGEMTLDKLAVPLVNATPFQFGLGENTTAKELYIVAALNGETLARVPQPLPGGLSSLINCDTIHGRGLFDQGRRGWCKAMFDNPRLNSASETTEIAGPLSGVHLNTSNDVAEAGVTLTLPVKIHLESPLLGRDCYIGSDSDPIVWNFTTGETDPPPPNKPIRGHFGTAEFSEEGSLIVDLGHEEGDNAFALPTASGCGVFLSSWVDSLIDNTVGLPSPAGYNTIIHQGYNKEAYALAVIASEQ